MNLSALTLRSDRPQKIQGDAYLKFKLASGFQAVLSMKQVQEVLALPANRLTPMPNMPACILGLMNRRSHVMWVVDLAQMLGISKLDANAREYNLMIVRAGTVILGLSVQQVGGISWITSDAIQPAPNHLTMNLLPYLRGCTLSEQEILLVLDADAIVHSSILHHHS